MIAHTIFILCSPDHTISISTSRLGLFIQSGRQAACRLIFSMLSKDMMSFDNMAEPIWPKPFPAKIKRAPEIILFHTPTVLGRLSGLTQANLRFVDNAKG